MGIHTTKYKTENGKTRKVKGPAKQAGSGATGKPGADNQNARSENPAR